MCSYWILGLAWFGISCLAAAVFVILLHPDT